MENVGLMGKTCPETRTPDNGQEVRRSLGLKGKAGSSASRRIVPSNYRKIKRIFVLTIQYRENYALINEAIAERNGHLAGDLLRNGLRILAKIRRLAENYDKQPHTIADIEADMHSAEMRIRARNCIAFAARLGISPAKLLDRMFWSVLQIPFRWI